MNRTCAALGLLFTAGALSYVTSPSAEGGGDPPQPKGLAALSWLEGGWEGDDDAGHWETAYTSAQGGSMLSSMKRTSGGKEAHYDFERWREDGGLVVMTPFPGGAPSVDFREAELDPKARRVVLKNAEHDFPRSFVYACPTPDRLVITLEGEDAGKPMKIVFDLKRRKSR